MDSALSENAIANRLNNILHFVDHQTKKKVFYIIVTGNEKWIYFDNFKRKKSWVDAGQIATFTLRCNIHNSKILLCIWWDREGVVWIVKSERNCHDWSLSTTIINWSKHYIKNDLQLRLNDDIMILLHDNAWSHIKLSVK